MSNKFFFRKQTPPKCWYSGSEKHNLGFPKTKQKTPQNYPFKWQLEGYLNINDAIRQKKCIQHNKTH